MNGAEQKNKTSCLDLWVVCCMLKVVFHVITVNRNFKYELNEFSQ